MVKRSGEVWEEGREGEKGDPNDQDKSMYSCSLECSGFTMNGIT